MDLSYVYAKWSWSVARLIVQVVNSKTIDIAKWDRQWVIRGDKRCVSNRLTKTICFSQLCGGFARPRSRYPFQNQSSQLYITFGKYITFGFIFSLLSFYIKLLWKLAQFLVILLVLFPYMTVSFNVRLRGELAMPHEKERKRERGMQFRVTLRMLILPVSDHRYIRSSGNSLPNLLR